jgi:pilus assembly protein Flp/PilA
MPCLTQAVWHFVRDERGATAIEYGLIAALMAVAALGGMSALGGGLGGSWSNTANKVSDAMDGN